MNLFRSLKLRFPPPQLTDLEFREFLFMYIANAPERAYWECEWRFPIGNNVVSIGIPGDKSGTDPKARGFLLALPARFENILIACRPQLQSIFAQWLPIDLPSDIFSKVKPAGFELEDANEIPIEWDIAFETTGKKWSGITIPFVGEVAQPAVQVNVD
jgi:hypothetical protein